MTYSDSTCKQTKNREGLGFNLALVQVVEKYAQRLSFLPLYGIIFILIIWTWYGHPYTALQYHTSYHTMYYTHILPYNTIQPTSLCIQPKIPYALTYSTHTQHSLFPALPSTLLPLYIYTYVFLHNENVAVIC